MKDNADLLDKLAVYNAESEGRGRILFPEYLAQDMIQNGIRNGKFKKAIFQVCVDCFIEFFIFLSYLSFYRSVYRIFTFFT